MRKDIWYSLEWSTKIDNTSKIMTKIYESFDNILLLMFYESRHILKCNFSNPLDFNSYITQNNKGEVINYTLKLQKKCHYSCLMWN